MGVTRSIAKAHAVISILVLVGCIAVSVVVLAGIIVPKVSSLVHAAAEKYDVLLPQITIRDGKASMKGKEPYFVDLGTNEVVVGIDTREGGTKEALKYLKPAQSGAVLTREALVTKNQRQIRIIPLRGVPDVTLNSREILRLADLYLPVATWWIWIGVICYFCLSKPIQLLILSLIPFFGARSYSVDLSYGEALKIGIFSMVPPALLTAVLPMDRIGIMGSLVIYFAVYVGMLILSVWDLVRRSGEISPSTGGIHPS